MTFIIVGGFILALLCGNIKTKFMNNQEFKAENKQILFQRVWAMPNKLTFTIKPIKELVEKYIKEGQVIIDPFANESKYGTIRNDLNHEFDTHYHLDALAEVNGNKQRRCSFI